MQGCRRRRVSLRMGPIPALTSSFPRASRASRRGGDPRRALEPRARAAPSCSGPSSPRRSAGIVREKLCTLELPYRAVQRRQGQPGSGRLHQARSGRMQVPYLEDPNTGTGAVRIRRDRHVPRARPTAPRAESQQAVDHRRADAQEHRESEDVGQRSHEDARSDGRVLLPAPSANRGTAAPRTPATAIVAIIVANSTTPEDRRCPATGKRAGRSPHAGGHADHDRDAHFLGPWRATRSRTPVLPARSRG